MLDNCEHLVDGVGVLLERLLAACPRLTVLATSRARLLVPYERVFPVPGAVAVRRRRPGDAVELFLERARRGRRPGRRRPTGTGSLRICRGLDGMALAIELAAARLPVAGPGRPGGRAGRPARPAHRRPAARRPAPLAALRAGLELRAADRGRPGDAAPGLGVRRAVHRRGGGGACWPAGRPSSRPAVRRPALAGLAEQSLLVAVAGPDGHPLPRPGDDPPVRGRTARRGRRAGRGARPAPALVPGRGGRAGEALVSERAEGRAAFDQVADELRAALDWARDRAGPARRRRTGSRSAWRSCASRVACRARPSGGTSRRPRSRRTTTRRQSALRDAAAAAEIRHFGGDAMRLHRACAAAALRAGDRPRAAIPPGAGRGAGQPRPGPDAGALAAG